jgi:paraquat-inducible protein B
VVGGFILGALAVGVCAILFFGGTNIFGRSSRVVVFFDEAVAGLEVGAPVTFHGAVIGSVESIAVRYSPDTMTIRIPVVLKIDPSRVTWAGKRLSTRFDYEHLVQGGLRARLALQSLISGELRVDLEFLPNTPLQRVGEPVELPEIPAAPSEFNQLRNQLAELQLRQFVESAQDALSAITRLSDHLNARIDPLADRAERAADAANHAVRTADRSVFRVTADATTALRHLDSLLVDAKGELDTRGGELSRTLVATESTARKAEILLDSLNGLTEPRSRFRDDLESTARDLAAASSSLRGFAETIERNPGALLAPANQ